MDKSMLSLTLMATAILLLAAGRVKGVGVGNISDKFEALFLKTGAKFGSEDDVNLLRTRIKQADLNLTPEFFIGLQIALPAIVVVSLLPLLIVGIVDILLLIMFAAIPFFLPRVWLNRKAKERVDKINRELPEFCILFSAVLEETDFLTAMTEVSDAMGGEVGKEFQRALSDIDNGKPRSKALEDMADRCGVPDLTELVRKINQYMRHGTSGAAKEIRSHVKQMMDRRRNLTSVRAGKLVISTLPYMTVFILAPLIGLMLFPVGYNVWLAFR